VDPVIQYIVKVIDCYLTPRKVWRYQREVIIIRESKKDRKHNGQKKKYKRTNNDLQNTTKKHEPIKISVNSSAQEEISSCSTSDPRRDIEIVLDTS